MYEEVVTQMFDTLAEMSKAVMDYIDNDVNALYEICWYSMPNNKLKMLGCPMRRYAALRKVMGYERKIK